MRYSQERYCYPPCPVLGVHYNLDKLQLQSSIDTYKAQYTLLISVLTALIATDLSIIGYAVKEQSANLCYVSCFFPIAIYVMTRIIEKSMVPIIFTAVSIEQRYKRDGEEIADRLVSTFLFASLSNCLIPDYNGIKSIVSSRSEYQFVKPNF